MRSYAILEARTNLRSLNRMSVNYFGLVISARVAAARKHDFLSPIPGLHFLIFVKINETKRGYKVRKCQILTIFKNIFFLVFLAIQ